MNAQIVNIFDIKKQKNPAKRIKGQKEIKIEKYEAALVSIADIIMKLQDDA